MEAATSAIPEKVQAAANRLLADPEWRSQIKEGESFFRDGHVWCHYQVRTEDLAGWYDVEICPATGETRCGCRWHEFHETCKHSVAVLDLKAGHAPQLPNMLPGLFEELPEAHLW